MGHYNECMGIVVDCDAYDEVVKGFESICSSWPLFIDYEEDMAYSPQGEIC